MHAEQAAEWMRRHPFGDVDCTGVDRSLIERCLALPPLERVRRNWLATRNVHHARVDPRMVQARVNGRA
jgi:hypothetical protein